MKIESGDDPSGALITYVVEACEARAVDGIHAMVGNQKVLLPPHKETVGVGEVVHETILIELLLKGSECCKSFLW